ncbi:MAG: GNAT family N-acetyltransferase [Alphaproteobacteria bacterium]|nr:GNAT family N-acetyltransferase [Alphaproteobacteria bacterium]
MLVSQNTLGSLQFSFSTDVHVIKDYYDIVKNVYRNEMHIRNINLPEVDPDEFDFQSDFLIILSNGVCVGGARITTSYPKNKNLIPLENENFPLSTFIPDLQYHAYSEISRLAVLPEFRKQGLVADLFRYIIIRSLDNNISSIFAKSSKIHTINYRRSIKKLGLDINCFNYPFKNDFLNTRYKKNLVMLCLKDVTNSSNGQFQRLTPKAQDQTLTLVA